MLLLLVFFFLSSVFSLMPAEDLKKKRSKQEKQICYDNSFAFCPLAALASLGFQTG